MDIKKHNDVTVLSRWIVKYDDVWQMPHFIQGLTIGDSNEHKNGEAIVIKNIESIDLKDRILKTYSGSVYKLIGSGKRMLILDDDEIVEITFKGTREFYNL